MSVWVGCLPTLSESQFVVLYLKNEHINAKTVLWFGSIMV